MFYCSGNFCAFPAEAEGTGDGGERTPASGGRDCPKPLRHSRTLQNSTISSSMSPNPTISRWPNCARAVSAVGATRIQAAPTAIAKQKEGAIQIFVGVGLPTTQVGRALQGCYPDKKTSEQRRA